MVYKQIELDVWNPPFGEIRVIQEEADGRELLIRLFDNGAPLDLTGKKVSIFIRKPDDTIIYNACTVSENTAAAIHTESNPAAVTYCKKRLRRRNRKHRRIFQTGRSVECCRFSAGGN